MTAVQEKIEALMGVWKEYTPVDTQKAEKDGTPEWVFVTHNVSSVPLSKRRYKSLAQWSMGLTILKVGKDRGKLPDYLITVMPRTNICMHVQHWVVGKKDKYVAYGSCYFEQTHTGIFNNTGVTLGRR